MFTGFENKDEGGSVDGVVLLLLPRSYTLIVAGGAVLGIAIAGFACLLAAGVVFGGASLKS